MRLWSRRDGSAVIDWLDEPPGITPAASLLAIWRREGTELSGTVRHAGPATTVATETKLVIAGVAHCAGVGTINDQNGIPWTQWTSLEYLECQNREPNSIAV